ncbi:MAG: pectate lyase [Kiritimatiellae bacterium]|nr:pectate lyase [Kiritimatiellia bacterium]MDD5521736.1 pectate lyase [Kiritimatiellia bacterium]
MNKILILVSLFLLSVTASFSIDDALVAKARDGLARTVRYLRTEVAVGGGYLGSYKADLSDQWGEGHATRDQNWIQPPGCPSVGFAFLRAWEGTGEPQYLDAAVEVARSLVSGQLECGGWNYIVDHSQTGARKWYYRKNRNSTDEKLKKGANQATFDDNTTQHATRLLMAVDKALEQKDPAIHEAVLASLDFFLKAQNAAGGWPQRFPLSAKGYSSYSTYNDNAMTDCVDVMISAWKQYKDKRYYDAAVRAGDFTIRVQQPEPQPVWAQQYDQDLKPAPARKFEPVSVTAGESGGALRILLYVALLTGDDKYLKPIGPALEWYKRSELTGKDKGKWARFYELRTNRPLYFTAGTYQLTYDDSNMPTHYSFKSNWYPRHEERQWQEMLAKGIPQYLKDHEPKSLSKETKLKKAVALESKVREILQAQDDKGRWVEKDMIEMGTFERYIQNLAEYLRFVNDR